MKPEILDRRYNKSKKNRYEFKVRCPGCNEERWTPSSNYAQSRTGLCSRCQLKNQYLPIGVKWKGRLTPISIVGRIKQHNVYRFKCDCGKEIDSTAHACIRSCGCLRHEPRLGSRKPDKNVALVAFFNHYRSSARTNKRQFALSLGQFKDLVTSPCFYSGDKPVLRTYHTHGRHVSSKFNGIDRIDSAKGYTLDNVVPCSPTCNIAKSDMSQSDFIAWIKRTATHVSKIST